MTGTWPRIWCMTTVWISRSTSFTSFFPQTQPRHTPHCGSSHVGPRHLHSNTHHSLCLVHAASPACIVQRSDPQNVARLAWSCRCKSHWTRFPKCWCRSLVLHVTEGLEDPHRWRMAATVVLVTPLVGLANFQALRQGLADELREIRAQVRQALPPNLQMMVAETRTL